jgi:hypothetical protein
MLVTMALEIVQRRLANRRACAMNGALRSSINRAVFAVAILLAVSVSAAAQTQVRVVRDQAIIWRREARIPITTVKAGTMLEVVGRQDDWYIVVVPPESGGTGESGMIAAAQVEAAAGSTVRTPTAGVQTRTGTAARRPVAAPSKPVEVFGFGQVALTTWLAHDTFAAVLGHSVAPLFGGGVEVHLHDRVFIEGGVEWFQQTGQRVFVNDGQAFKLGIPDTVRVIPLTFSAGYRHRLQSVTPYVGGGAGVYFYKETSAFSDASENLSERFTSYHALGGVELGLHGIWRTAFEVQFTTVPDALGPSGAAAAFGEHNLGGVQFRFKLMAGG